MFSIPGGNTQTAVSQELFRYRLCLVLKERDMNFRAFVQERGWRYDKVAGSMTQQTTLTSVSRLTRPGYE